MKLTLKSWDEKFKLWDNRLNFKIIMRKTSKLPDQKVIILTKKVEFREKKSFSQVRKIVKSKLWIKVILWIIKLRLKKNYQIKKFNFSDKKVEVRENKSHFEITKKKSMFSDTKSKLWYRSWNSDKDAKVSRKYRQNFEIKSQNKRNREKKLN